MPLVTRNIWLSFQKEGTHKYPAAASDPNLATGDEYDVSFLAFPHRHIFHFKVKVSVDHDDRDIEFIQFKRWCEGLYAGETLQLDYKSCEMLAEELIDAIQEKYGRNRTVTVDVSEDNENGAEITKSAWVSTDEIKPGGSI
tara:strand:- start:1184 stop:1606 length:423 start_codon:yes stop_codon:yes gene_type:complete